MRLIPLVIVFVGAALAGCATTLDDAPVHIARPIESIGEGANLSRDGRFYFAGQPDPETLRRLAERGVVKVVNIRQPQEMDRVGFDEPALLSELDVAYVNLPLPTSDLGPAADAWVDQLASELSRTRGPVLIHCNSSDRVGGAWGRYLRVHRGFSAEDALLRARAAGMRSEDAAEWVASPVPYQGGGRR